MALWTVGAKGLYRGLQRERLMGSLGVVKHQPVSEFSVEKGDVGEQTARGKQGKTLAQQPQRISGAAAAPV